MPGPDSSETCMGRDVVNITSILMTTEPPWPSLRQEPTESMWASSVTRRILLCSSLLAAVTLREAGEGDMSPSCCHAAAKTTGSLGYTGQRA